ncbi:hypothetical protein [Photobacterium sp. R1]
MQIQHMNPHLNSNLQLLLAVYDFARDLRKTKLSLKETLEKIKAFEPYQVLLKTDLDDCIDAWSYLIMLTCSTNWTRYDWMLDRYWEKITEFQVIKEKS